MWAIEELISISAIAYTRVLIKDRTMDERRLPVYFLIDVSASMDGEPILTVGTIIQRLLADLRADPCALETAWISVITFGDNTKQVVPLTPLDEFRIPKFTIGGGAAFGPALSLLCECREFEVVKATAERKGDWRPIVLTFVNGSKPVGDIDKGIHDFMSHKWWSYVFIAVGQNADIVTLRRISRDRIISIESVGPETLQKYFQWVVGSESSMRTCSNHVVVRNMNDAELEDFPPIPEGLL